MTDAPASKTCTKCEEDKPLGEFYRDRSSKDGIQKSCKACTKARNNARYVRKTQPIPEAKDPVNNKVCSRCKEEVAKSEFYKDSRSKDGLNGVCAPCSRSYNNSKYNRKTTPTPRAANPSVNKVCSGCFKEKLKSKFSVDNHRDDGLAAYCLSCKRGPKRGCRDTAITYSREYYRKNRQAILAHCRSPEVRGRARSRFKERYESDAEFKAKVIMRAHLSSLLKKVKVGKNGSTSKVLGYSHLELKARVECQFQPGMSWDNHGEWHIDHKIPVARFLERGETRPHIINALSNLQPMWAVENMRKGARWVG